jgi:hypothetical protein
MYTGGDIKTITYNHPSLGSGTLFPKAGEDGTLDPGGYTSADDAAGVTGNGQNLIDIITAKRASFEILCAWDMADADELDTVNNMAASPLLADWTITHISGAVYGGKGKPVGDVQGSTGAATFALKLAFEGKLSKL